MAALLDLDPVLKARKAKDHLSLRSNQSVHKLLRGFAAGKPEEVRFSDFIVKINPQEKPQERVLLITNKAIYNLLPSDYGRSKRRIAIEMLGMVTVSQLSDEFVLHVPSEYDYRLMSLRKREVIECLQQCYKECTGRE